MHTILLGNDAHSAPTGKLQCFPYWNFSSSRGVVLKRSRRCGHVFVGRYGAPPTPTTFVFPQPTHTSIGIGTVGGSTILVILRRCQPWRNAHMAHCCCRRAHFRCGSHDWSSGIFRNFRSSFICIWFGSVHTYAINKLRAVMRTFITGHQ